MFDEAAEVTAHAQEGAYPRCGLEVLHCLTGLCVDGKFFRKDYMAQVVLLVKEELALIEPEGHSFRS